jgi:hypothetical protein
VILRPVNRGIPLFAAFSKLTYVLFWFILLLDLFGALRLLGGAGFSTHQINGIKRCRTLFLYSA